MDTNEAENCGSETDGKSDNNFPNETYIDNPGSCLVKHHVDRDKVKLLLICPNEEQRLYTFDTPAQDCTIEDLLNEARIPIDKGIRISLAKDLKMEIDYVVQFVSREYSHSEEGGEQSDDNVDESVCKKAANKSSGFFSSMEDNCSDSSTTQDEIVDKKNSEGDEFLKSGQRTPEPLGVIEEQNPDTPCPKLFDESDCLVCSSLDRGDRGKVNSEEPRIENNSSMLDDPEETIKDRISEEEEPIFANTNSTCSTVDFIDYQENIQGGGVPREIQNMICDSSIESSYTSLPCETIMIGSHIYTPQESVVISQSGVKLRAPCLTDDTEFVLVELKFEDIAKVVINFGNIMPVLFLYVKVKAADTIRELLGMKDLNGPYYNALSKDKTKKLITLLLHEITERSKLVLKMLFAPKKLLAQLTGKEAADLLLSVSPANIRPQIKSLIKKAEKAQSTVDDINNDEVKIFEEKTQSSSKISKQITSEFDDNVNDENKMPVRKSQGLIQVSERTRLILENAATDKQIHPIFKKPANPRKRSIESSSMVDHPLKDKSEILLVYPPPPVRGGITITVQDHACLRKGQFLNDVIIDFYLKYLTHQVLSEEDRNRTHVFSIHFYKRLTSQSSPAMNNNKSFSPAAKRHINVQKWTKHFNIFEKDFVVIPINQNAHWFLAIICFPGLVGKAQEDPNAAEPSDGKKVMYKRRKAKEMKLQVFTKNNQRKIKRVPCILVFDSLAGLGSNAQSVIRTLRDYLSYEYLAKFGTAKVFSEKTIEGASLDVPQQSNFSDCGLYVLQYVESFFKDPITDYTLPIETLKHWFNEVVVSRKRKEISWILKKLIES